jgi:hypothetical protein
MPALATGSTLMMECWKRSYAWIGDLSITLRGWRPVGSRCAVRMAAFLRPIREGGRAESEAARKLGAAEGSRRG